MASSAYPASAEHTSNVPAGLSVTDLLLLLMALIWGFNFIVVKFATGVFAPLAFNSARIALAVVVLWAIVLVRGVGQLTRRDVIGLLALGVIGNGLYQIFWVEGLARTRASDAALLVASSPAFIEVIGVLRGNERTSMRGLAGIALSLAGIALIVSGGSTHSSQRASLAGNALILLSCLCWALYTVLLKPYTERIDGLTLSAVAMTGGLGPMLLAGAPSLLHTNWGAVSALGWSAVAYSGLMALVVAYLCWYEGLRVLGATRAAMYSNLQPLIAMFAAWLLLHETPHATQLLGGACIVGGLLLTRTSGPQPVASK